MAVIGGDIIEITYNHPTLGSGVLYPKAGEDATIDLGGLMKNDDAQSITASGEVIHQMNRKRWKVEAPPISNSQDRNELLQLQALQDSPVDADWTFAHISGAIYSGKGSVVGDLTATTNDPVITLMVAGGGRLAKTA